MLSLHLVNTIYSIVWFYNLYLIINLWNTEFEILGNAFFQGLPLTYAEFCELLSLGKIESLSNIDPRISPILAQPISWYQGLIKLLMTKYSDHHRTFVSIDGSLQYFLVLHPRISDGFIMISLDQESVQGVRTFFYYALLITLILL